MPNLGTQQAIVVDQDELVFGRTATRLALFNPDGSVYPNLGATELRIKELGPNIMHPDFGGADPSGVGDSTNAMKAVINQASQIGGGGLRACPMIIPQGRFRLTDTLVFDGVIPHIVGVSGWSDPGAGAPSETMGSAVVWDGDNSPMIKVRGTRGLVMRDFMLIGNSNPTKRPSACVHLESVSGKQNSLMTFEHMVFGKLSGYGGFSPTDIVTSRGLWFDNSVVNAMNDASMATMCRFDGCVTGWEASGTQSVLSRIRNSQFWYNGTAVKSAADLSLESIYISLSSVTDFDLSSGSRVFVNYLASEQSYMFAKILGSGTSLIVDGGYWQMSNNARSVEGDRKIVVAVDDANQSLRLRNFQFTAFSGYDTSLRPILSVKPNSNSLSAHKMVDLDNVRWYVAADKQGFVESMLDVTPPAGSNSSITVQGNVQYSAPGSSSSNEGKRKFFYNRLIGGQTPNFDRDDRVSPLIPNGQYRSVKGSTGTTRTLTTGTEFCVPVDLAPGQTIDRIAVNVTVAAAGTINFGVRQDVDGKPSATVTSVGTADSSTTGIKEVTVSVPLSGKTIWLSVEGPTGVTITGVNGPVRGIDLNSSSTATAVYGSFSQTGVSSGTFPATTPTNSAAGSGPLATVRTG